MAGEELASIKYRTTKRIALILFCGVLILGLSRTNASAEPSSSCAALRSMARIYMASGGYAKAEPFLERALRMARETNVPETETSACMLDLAYLYKSQGKLTTAEAMCLSGLALQQKAYHPDHPYVAHTLRILCEIYRRESRYEEAVTALERAITIIRDESRADELELAPFKVDMARLLTAQGMYAQAESYYKETIDIIRTHYGPEHFYTAKVLASMAELYVLQESYVQAETLISQALPIQERVYGPDHHLLVPIRLTAAKIHLANGDLANAWRLLDQSLHAIENHPGPTPRIESDIWNALGQWYALSGKYHQAEKAYEKALHILGTHETDSAQATQLKHRAEEVRRQQLASYTLNMTSME